MEYTKGERQVVYNATKERFEVRIFRGKNCLGTFAMFVKEEDAILDMSAPDLYEACKMLLEGSELDPNNPNRAWQRACPNSEAVVSGFKALAKTEGK